MNEDKVFNLNLPSKRVTQEDEKPVKDEPPNKSQRLSFPFNDDQYFQGPVMDTQFESYDITEENYNSVAATTLYKKLQVLEIRDRILRTTTTQSVKDINVDEIKPLKGTCYDMCPEKERLLRIHGNMVSQFECKIVDFKLEPVFEIMVKQYTRSSADQANPLPHELRSTPVLVKTINYMLKNIIYPIESKTEQDLASWYDFCWDRLRAIRKDIVQQNLQNFDVIRILEQIGRFHIACYDLMLGYSGFDIKLNTENLNNCIQMLMPMYRDSDYQCPNEPEFVSYELLMHLGNPQFHTAYDLLPIHIKQSPEVRFCIKAHITFLESSNCIDFFNLLKNTTYMNCCILQRVIPIIRHNNLQMMNKSYTTVKRIYRLEMQYFMEKLCFDDLESAQEFCRDTQLKFDSFYVDLSRNIILCAPEHRRQKQELFIVKKRLNLTYQICGKYNLPDVIISSVHSSFDSNDHLHDPISCEFNGDVENNVSDILVKTGSNFGSNCINKSSFNSQKRFFSPTSVYEIPTYPFNVPNFSSQVQTQSFNFEKHGAPSIYTRHDNLSQIQSTLPKGLTNSPSWSNSMGKYPSTLNNNLFIKSQNAAAMHLSSMQSPNRMHFTGKQQFMTQWSTFKINLARKYFSKWQSWVKCRKLACIEEMFAHGELFHSECISSLSSSPSSVNSLSFNFNNTNALEESKRWQHQQFSLAEKYYRIWLRNVLRRRRKIEIDSVTSLPWPVFMQTHGTPKETLIKTGSKIKTEDGKRVLNLPSCHPLFHNNNVEYDISEKVADVFVKNFLDLNKDKIVSKKIFWKLAVNYGESLEPNSIERKVLTLIYGKKGFNSNQVQTVYTDYNKYFIKSVISVCGLYDWKKVGLSAALLFTNTYKEHIEMLFKRVDIILKSTPIAIPLVVIFSSTSDKNEIKHYRSVLDTYCENNYINKYSLKIWQGPTTVLEALEFFSENYVDITPGFRSENLFYNLLNFAHAFYLKMRYLLPSDNPNTIIVKYNQCLDNYIKLLGRNNLPLRNVASEFVPYYTQNPTEFSIENSNFNLKYFENILNDAHLMSYEPWPPNSVNDLIDYVKRMCQLTNRRCWCLDILQMLQLHRQADLDHCILNASWYEVIEMWIQGVLGKCSNTRNNFTVFYNGNPIKEALKTVFPDN